MATNSRRKQPANVGPDQLMRLEGSSSSKRGTEAVTGSTLLKDGKRFKGLTDEIITGKNHVNPSLILHLAKSTKDDGISKSKMNAIICQALKQLKAEKTEKAWFMSLVTLAKLRSELFTADKIVEVLCSHLERDPSQTLHKGRNSSLLPVLSFSLLMTAYKKHENWPEIFVKAYVKDAIHDRIWIENPMCKQYCNEIVKVFGTSKPATVSPTSAMMGPSKPETDPIVLSDDYSAGSSTESQEESSVSIRYKNSAVQESIQQFVMKTVKEYFTQKKAVDNMTRNFVKFLCTSCGYQEIRELAVGRLDAFLNSTKLSRPAQDLLSYVAANTKTGSAEDIDVVQKLSQLRIKSKPMVNFYTSCMKELLTLHPSNIEHMMKTVLYNELSTNRNMSNMQLIAAFFQQDSERSAIVLAHIFQELLLQPEDCLRSLRALLREIVRVVHHELKFSQFALALMQEITLPAFRDADPKLQERTFLSLNSLICLTILLSCKPSIRDIAMSSTKTDVLPYIKFQNEVAVMQKNAVWWLHKIVPAQYRVSGKHYFNSLKQVLFLDDAVNYASKDNWPPDSERDTLVSLCSEVPLLENTLMRLGVLGTANNLPLRPQEVLGIINNVVRRAAMLDSDGDVPPPLQITGQLKHNLDIIQMLIKLSEYKYYNVKFPEGYTPPMLVIGSHYWRVWQILLILAAFNPTTVGVLAWNNHPTLRGFMEMVITNNYQFPLNSMNYQESMVLEKQLCSAEESDILIFEGHLAASRGVKITKQNSQLLNQLLVVTEGGPMRKPPQAVLDQTRLLAMELHLGHRLHKIREPDFLLDIIKEQGTSKSMSWLSELVKSSENSFELLPVPCLCEFLLQDIQNTKRHVLLKRLQAILNGTNDSAQSHEIVSYFISKMSASYVVRYKALKGLKTIFNRSLDDEANEDWLLVDLVNIPLHTTVSSTVCVELRKALFVEQSNSLLSAYLIYLCKYSPQNAKIETARDIALSIVSRNDVMIKVLHNSESVLEALLILFLRLLIIIHKDFDLKREKSISIVIENESKHIEVEIVQAILVLLAEARGRDIGKDDSVSQLMDILFRKSNGSLLNEDANKLCSDSLIPVLIGSGVRDLQELAMKNLTHQKMIDLLKDFSLLETAAQFILEKLDEEIVDVVHLLTDEDELISHVQAWRISVSAGEKLEHFLKKKSVEFEEEEPDHYATMIKDEVMEVDEVQQKQKEWSQIVQEIFEEDSIESQSHLMTYCLQNKNTEEICLTLFLWVQSHKLPERHEQFISVVVQMLAQNCANTDLLEKLMIEISSFSKSLQSLHLKLFPSSRAYKEMDQNVHGSLLSWCEDPRSESYEIVLKKLESINIDSEPDKRKLGGVLQKFLKTSVRNNGKYGIDLKLLVKLVVAKMVESPKSSGLFMDWLQILSPEFDCFKLFLECESEVPVPLQRYMLNVICSNCGWDTLHECINCLLSPNFKGFHESLILDFLQGCSNNERIWQGANSKRGTNKGSLKLSKEQLWQLCLLIMTEVSSIGEKEDGSTQDKRFILLSWRLPLILSPFHKSFLPELVYKLQNHSNKASKLLEISLYLAEPTVFFVNASNIINGALSCTDTAASCDSLIHQLINNVCDNKKNCASGYILLRRLAVYHPPLMLRHLDLLTSALGTPTTATKNEFIKANHGAVFINIIGILEGLGVHLFKKDANKILTECLEFVTVHTKHEPRLYTATIMKISQILLWYLETDRAKAMELLNKDYISKLKMLENRFKDPLLTELVDCIVGGKAPNSSDIDEMKMVPYLNKLCTDSSESLSILQELDAGSSKKPSVLKMFLHEICRRMTNDSADCRSIAHKLAIRHVRHAPKDSSIVFSYIREAFQNPQQDVIKSVLEEIPELILLSGPETPMLMRLAFSACAKSNIDMSQDFLTIIKTVITSSDLF